MQSDSIQSTEKDTPASKRVKKDKDKSKENLSESIEVNPLKICEQSFFKTYMSLLGSFEVPQITPKTEGLTPLWTLLS